MAYNIKEIMALPRAERLELAGRLMQSMEHDAREPQTSLQKRHAQLNRRLESKVRGGAAYQDWEEVKKTFSAIYKILRRK